MHVQHQKGLPPSSPKDHIDDYEIYAVRKSEKLKIKKQTLSFPFLPTATAKKATSTLNYCRSPQFIFCL